MRRGCKITDQRLFIGIVWLNAIYLLILMAFVWTWTVQSGNRTLTECVDTDACLRRVEFPLLCIFTTFEPNAEKLPVTRTSDTLNHHPLTPIQPFSNVSALSTIG